MLNEIIILNEDNLKDYIYFIRGQKVMLDSDLAKIYGYTAKTFNQQVQRNIEKFDNDFMFQLTDKETSKLLRSQNVTLNKNNNKRFDNDFMLQLTNEEVKELSRCKNFTMNKKGRGYNIKYNPYAFTEQGIYMLMMILKGEKAINQGKTLIRLFKSMKVYY